ncbi:dTDP-4-dehydrorhamnose reductase family protein [Bdellovibrio bacteriovorus]|uniref:dTDP-4-dehydrorhamnose reductase family protein n=1 Tax=Bdellovibrio bacteriovorus TaxID=959 RepID=UPI0035A621F4
MKILIIGAAGMLGHQVLRRLQAQYKTDVYGTVRKAVSYYSGYNVFQNSQLLGDVDVLDFSSLENILNKVQPRWIINCVGLTLRKEDVASFEKCLEINSMLPHRLSLWALKNSAKLIHFSTDCVFDGRSGNYRESDIPTATDLYGKSKFLGETHLKSSLTMRLSIIGRELEGKTELVEWFLSQKNTSVKGYTRAMYSGLTTIRVANEVARIIEKFPELYGLYQVSSQPISKFDLLQLLNKHFVANVNISPFDGYLADKTLNCDRYSYATAFSPPTWEEMIYELSQDKMADYGDI